MCIGSQAVLAQAVRTNGPRHGRSELWIEPHALLETVTSFDLQEGVSRHPTRVRAPAPTVLSHPRSLTTRFESPPTGAPITVVRREISPLWHLRVRGDSSLPFTRVEYDLIGANGRHGVLSHSANDTSVIEVRVVELPLRVSDRATGLGTVEGGVILEMDLGHAVEAGRYSGSLRVTVIQL
ncbi:MAG: hypothetical protein ACC742_07845 [Thermoanaerobaculales bacterium]